MRTDFSLSMIPYNQLAKTFQRLGSHFRSKILDGGIPSRFDSRNFILPLQRNHYLAIVCPLDHTYFDSTYLSKGISKRPVKDGDSGIFAVHVTTPSCVVKLN